MANRSDVTVSAVGSVAYFESGNSNYLVETSSGILYSFYESSNNSNLFYKKSTDGGVSWSNQTLISAIDYQGVAVWYDRWSGINADLIHLAYIDATTDDVLYKNINTASSDTQSSETVIFAGASTSMPNGALTIARARGGNLLCVFSIDGATEHGVARSIDVGANWTSRSNTGANESSDGDQYVVVPSWNADNQDMMMFFWDASANEISRKLYDDSADTWAETSIATSMVELAVGSGFPNFATVVDLTNSQNLLVAWSDTDTVGADLRIWKVTEVAITEMTNVVLDSGDDQAFCTVAIDNKTGYWWVAYAGKADGSESYAVSMKIYVKISTDGGTTWGNEFAITEFSRDIRTLICAPKIYTSFKALVYSRTLTGGAGGELIISTETKRPKAAYMLGA